MKKLLVLLLAALLICSAASAEVKPDHVRLSGYYVSYLNGHFCILDFFGSDSAAGQVSICMLKNDLHDGPTQDDFIQDAYFEITGSEFIIKAKRSDPDLFASGAAGTGFLDLTLDGGETFYHFSSLPSDNKIIDKTDPFADVRSRFDEGFTVPAGLYVIGEDLPSGKFSFSSETGCKVDIQQNNYYHFEISLSPNESFNKYELIDQQYLLVSDGSVTLKTYTGLFD